MRPILSMLTEESDTITEIFKERGILQSPSSVGMSHRSISRIGTIDNCNPLDACGCRCQPSSTESSEFRRRWSLLTDKELIECLSGTSEQFIQTTNEIITCNNCRNATESLFRRITCGNCCSPPLVSASGLYFTDSISYETNFTLNEEYLSNSDTTLSLFLHQERWGAATLTKTMSNRINKASTKSKCALHSQRIRGRPRPAAFETLWKKLPIEHHRHLTQIDSEQFLGDLESYLRRHRFCCRCKEKVLEVYDLLIGCSCSDDACEDCGNFDCIDSNSEHENINSSEHILRAEDYGDELNYTSYIFDEITFSRNTNQIVLPCNLPFMLQLMTRADQENVGDWGDRHARTIAEAQDEVLTCLGIVVWDKMQALWMQSKTENRAEELLVHCMALTLRRNFDVAVEALHGQEMMEQLLAEEDDELERLAKKKEKRKEKKKKRKNATKRKQVDRMEKLDQSEEIALGKSSREQRTLSMPTTLSDTTTNSTYPDGETDRDDQEQDSLNLSDSNEDDTNRQNTEMLGIDENRELQLLSAMGWDPAASSLKDGIPVCPERDEHFEDDSLGIPDDEIEFWKRNHSSLVSKRNAQRQKLQEKFNQLLLRTNSVG